MTSFLLVLFFFALGIYNTSWKNIKDTFLFRYDKTLPRSFKNFCIFAGIFTWIYLGWGIYNLVIWIIK